MRTTLFLLSALAVAGCAANDGPARQAALAAVPGKAIGEPVTCIQQRDVERVEAVNDYVALVHMRGNRVYRMDFPQSCRGLKHDAFKHTSSTAQYCRGDIITLFDPTTRMQTGSCSFGSFIPYELPPKDTAQN